MTSPALAPFTSYRVKSYISVDMFKLHGRQGVDTALVSKGTPNQNDVALSEQIVEASAWMDSQIMQNSLAAHIAIETGRVNVNRDGYAEIFPTAAPIIGLMSASLGGSSQDMTALSSLAGVGVRQASLTIPAGPWPLTSTAGPLQFVNVSAPMDQAWYQIQLCAGFPVTTLTASAEAAATELEIDDTTGIIAGMTQLRVYSQESNWSFVPTAVSTATVDQPIGTGPGTLTLPSALPRALVSNPDFPIMISALPPDLIRCCKLVTRSFIKSSGGGNIAISTAQQKSPDPFGAGGDLAAAYQILTSYGAVQ
jgi:hypothetical protein